MRNVFYSKITPKTACSGMAGLFSSLINCPAADYEFFDGASVRNWSNPVKPNPTESSQK
jgi:hypothetical protein